MKTSLEHLPLSKQRDIELIKDVLLDEFEHVVEFAKGKKKYSRILMIILFGSYAKGTWVEDRASGYLSDYDILVVLNRKELLEEYKIWHTAEDRLSRKIKMPFNIIVHTLEEVNQHLVQGHYFFKDIKNEGILIYTTGSYKLVEPGNISPSEAISIAEKHFDHWFQSANEFFDTFQDDVKKQRLNKAAFELHQAAERFYSTVSLVFTNYKPNTHNLKHLNSLAISQDERFKDIFPQDTKLNRRRFELLKRAYVEARYSEHYKITAEELGWLAERVEHLKHLTESLCRERIASLKLESNKREA